MSEPSNETCAQVINALFLGVKVDRVALVVVGANLKHTIVASRPTVRAAPVAPALIDVAAKTKRTVHRVTDEVSIAVTPIIGGDNVLWVLAVQRDEPNGFAPAEVQVIEALGAQIIPTDATAGPRLRRNTIVDAMGLDDPSSVVWGEGSEASELIDYDGVLVAFGEMNPREPFGVGQLQDLFSKTVENMIVMANSHVAAVLHVDGAGFAPVAVGATDDAPNVAADDLISRTVVEQVLWTGDPVLTIDARRGDLGMSAQSIHKLEITMVTCVPVVLGTITVGALYTARFGLGTGFDEATRDKLIAEAPALGQALYSLRSK